MNKRSLGNLPENINYEELFQIDNKIEETESKIKDLEKRKERLANTGSQFQIDEIAMMIHLLMTDLNRFRKARSDLLGYLD